MVSGGGGWAPDAGIGHGCLRLSIKTSVTVAR
jgi:hypothetical protein